MRKHTKSAWSAAVRLEIYDPLIPVWKDLLAKGDWAEFRAKNETDFTIAPVECTGPANLLRTVPK